MLEALSQHLNFRGSGASLKTALVLALTTQSCGGDLQALSIQPSCLQFSPVCLQPNSSFLAEYGAGSVIVWEGGPWAQFDLSCHRQMCHWSFQNWSHQGNSQTPHYVIKESGITLSYPKILSGSCVCSKATQLITSLLFSKHESSLSEMEQMLCTCSGFVYLGTERFTAKIPPAKLAALNLSGTVQAIILFVSCCYIKSIFYFSQCMRMCTTITFASYVYLCSTWI